MKTSLGVYELVSETQYIIYAGGTEVAMSAFFISFIFTDIQIFISVYF